MTLSWRPDAPRNLVKLAVGRCLIDVMDTGKWTELGLLTNTERWIEDHPRLLRALHFGDEDYTGHVHDLVPRLLNEQDEPLPDLLPASVGLPVTKPIRLNLHERFPNLDVISDSLQIPAWIARRDARLFSQLFTDEAVAAMPDGVVLSETESAAARLGGVSSILIGAGELRNARGTGHGRSGVPIVSSSLARLSVGAVLPSVIYLIETYESTDERIAGPISSAEFRVAAGADESSGS